MKSLALENYGVQNLNSFEISETNGGGLIIGFSTGFTNWCVSEWSSFSSEFTKVMNKCNC